MAPWPEQVNEPKAPDKSCPKGVESNLSDSSKVDSGIQEDSEARSVLGKTDDKQDEKNSGVSELDDGQLKALLDEAITYKCPKDREGKSHLFRELLEEVEAESDGGEESKPPSFGIADQCRSGKRRRRDAAVSERQTRGGSLQNIVQAYSDFESAYSGGRGKKSLGGGRRKDYGPSSGGGGGRGGGGGGGGGGASGGSSVSARQREGGSLPCNVNVGGGSGGGGHHSSECPFEAVVVHRRRSEQRVSWDNNEDVMPAQMDRGGGGPVAAPPPADVAAVGRSEAGAERVIEEGASKGSPPECGVETTRAVDGVLANGVSSESGVLPQQQQGGGCEEGTCGELRAERCASLLSASVEDRTADGVELQLIPENKSVRGKFKEEVCRADSNACAPEVLEFVSEQSAITSTSLVAASPSVGSHKTIREMVRGDSVDTVVPFLLHAEEKKPPLSSASSSSMTQDLSKGLVNGTETKPLQLLSTYTSVNSVVGSNSQISSEPLASASLSASHPSCAVENQAIQSGVLEERTVLSVATKDAGVRKQPCESGPKAMMPIHQGTYPLATHHLSVLTYPPNHWFSASDTVSRLNFHAGKELNDMKSKSLDENGNAVTVPQGLSRDVHEKGKGKPRRPKFQDGGYMSESVEGYCGDQDLDRVLKFIGMDEDKKSKNSYSGPVERVRRNNIRRESDRSVGSEFTRVKSARDRNYMEEDISAPSSDKTSSGSKVGPRSAGGGRQNQIQHGNMMKKSNSLEEISRTKSEDLTLSASYNSMPPKEVVVHKSVVGVDGKESNSESCADNEDICNHNEKVVRDDSNGNVETGQKSLVPSAPPRVPMAATSFKEDFYAVTDASPQVLEETEFHVVTKKQRRKKRRGGGTGDGVGAVDGRGGTHNTQDCYSSVGAGGSNHGDRSDDLKRGCDRTEGDDEVVWGSGGTAGDGRFCSYRRHHRRHRGQRSGDRLKSTSSVPPSEHSGESSDDSDSVHSLPVSSSVPRPPVDPCSTSSGSTPQASYADIARMPFSTMPVVSSNPGSSPFGNPIPPVSTQKSKAPVSASPSGQTSNFPTVSNANPLGTPAMPHFASAKIGTPPVSGYKSAAVVPATVSTVDTFSSTVSCTLSNPKPLSQALASEEHENVSEAEVSIQNSVTVSLPVIEPRKKDAMTCTTLDCKTFVSNYSVSNVFSSQPKVENTEMAAHAVSANAPNILEDYYPSLQESIHEKIERRNGKLGQQQASMNKGSALEDKRSSKTATFTSSAPFTRENKVPEAETPVSNVGLVGEKATVVLPVVEKPPPVSVTIKTKEPSVTATRIKGSGRKPGFRSLPPVVIMDHHYRQDGASKEGSTVGDCSEIGGASGRGCSSDIGDFTFGFEVNEELLALSGVDAVVSHDPSPSGRVEGEDKPNGSPSVAGEEESQSLPAKTVISPVIQCTLPGKELMPVFHSPGDVDTKKFNYEKIVSFIGSSWEDVLKEMGVPSVKPTGNRVQYYDGAQ